MQSLQNQNELREHAIRATNIPYEWLEKLLPKLLLLPQTFNKAEPREREVIQKSIYLCERLLAKRNDISRLQKLIADSRQSENNATQVSKLRAFFDKQTFVGDNESREGRLAFEMRIAMAEGHYRNIPKDVIKMLSEWESVIDSRVGEFRLEGIERLMRMLGELHQRWNQVASDRQKPFLGIRDRLKLLTVASKVSKLKRKIRKANYQLAEQGQSLVRANENIQKLVAKVALFHSVPTAECGQHTQRIQQMVMLALEREANLALRNQCAELDKRLAQASAHIGEKNQITKQARVYIERAESAKNMRRVTLLKRNGVETFDLLSKAAEFQFRSTFSEVEQQVAQKSQGIVELTQKNEQLMHELKTLKNVYDDFITQQREGGTKANDNANGNTSRPT